MSASEARRVVDEVVACFSERPEEFVRRRHRELQRTGARNEEIFQQIVAELRRWRFTAPELSVRQLRRTIYG